MAIRGFFLRARHNELSGFLDAVTESIMSGATASGLSHGGRSAWQISNIAGRVAVNWLKQYGPGALVCSPGPGNRLPAAASLETARTESVQIEMPGRVGMNFLTAEGLLPRGPLRVSSALPPARQGIAHRP